MKLLSDATALSLFALLALPVSPVQVNPMLAPVSAALTAPAAYTGLCPTVLKFTGTIEGPANQSVSYAFVRTIKGVAASGMPTAAALDATGHLRVSDSISIDQSQAGTTSDVLQVWPGNVKSTSASVVVACVNAPVHALAQRAHLFVSEETSAVIYPYNIPDPYPYTKHCGTSPTIFDWTPSANANLRAGYATEKAYFQEHDVYASVDKVGFVPEAWEQICLHYIVTIGHYTDEPLKASTFFITAQHFLGGPMYCVTSISGAKIAAGEPGESAAGGPIFSPEACAALPPSRSKPNPMIAPPAIAPH